LPDEGVANPAGVVIEITAVWADTEPVWRI
jgi:hypothetical protein